MNLAFADWAILVGVYVALVTGVIVTKRHMRSVSDFLAAGRTAGRYVLSISSGMAALGAITIVANFEMNFEAGFTMAWWGQSMGLVILVMTVSGWVIYRFRQTRCLTLAEFFERRYSKRFRVFAGLVAFIAGLVNFGIFPAVGARFFIHFVGLPQEFDVLGLAVPTYPLTMAVLLLTALYFVYAGGQVAVIVTDFVQGLFANVVFVVLPVYLLLLVGWPRVVEAVADRPPGKSFINSFDTGDVENFNLGYFLIGVAGVFYGAMSWQGTQAYNTSAKSAHEAKMGGVLSNWRGIPQGLLMLLVPVLCYAVLRHPDFADVATRVQATLAGVESDTLRTQLRIPVVLTELLPVGLMGAFAAVMLAAFISTHDTYLHSWGSIFIQDVVMPFRKEPYTQEQHLRVLRWSILGVAVFIFLFSLLVQQTQHILLFFAITGAIYAGGSGAVIIGGLYWRRGTARAAWVALITGAVISVGGILLQQVWKDAKGYDFPINGQEFWGLGMLFSAALYVVVSLLDPKRPPELGRVLHRGRYEVPGERLIEDVQPSRGWKMLGITSEFSRRDKVLYVVTYLWSFTWIGTFFVGTIYNLSHDVSDTAWATYWEVYIWIQVAASVVVILWFTVGGLRDVAAMTRDLATMQRDETDDGMVRRDA